MPQRQSKKCNKKQRNDERRLKRTKECKQRTLMRLRRQQRNKTRYVSLICDFKFFEMLRIRQVQVGDATFPKFKREKIEKKNICILEGRDDPQKS